MTIQEYGVSCLDKEKRLGLDACGVCGMEMDMRTGIVMEIKGNWGIVLANGEYKRVKKGVGWKVGDRVDVGWRFDLGKKEFLAAACLCLMIMAGFGGRLVYGQETAVISIDVNPSIELGINRFGRVVWMSGRNEDGGELLEGLSLRNKTYQEALKVLLKDEVFVGYLRKEGMILFSVLEEEQGELLSKVTEAAKYFLQEEQRDVVVDGCQVDRKTLEDAHSHGMTAGKYVAVMELLAVDSGASMEEFTHCSIGEIYEFTKNCGREQESGEEREHNGHGSHHGR